jgi:DNA primase
LDARRVETYFSFVQEIERVDFKESLKMLAETCRNVDLRGIPLNYHRRCGKKKTLLANP